MAEATLANQEKILANQEKIVANQAQLAEILANQGEIVANQRTIIANQEKILANQDATHDGYDEALLLDVDGYVAEGAGENVFIVKKGKLYTPDLTSCLEGITRDSVLQLADELGIPVIEKRITRDEVYCADEAFFTGTAAEVTPIRELDNRQIGTGQRGPITTRIQSLFFDCVNGRVAGHADWLAYV